MFKTFLVFVKDNLRGIACLVVFALSAQMLWQIHEDWRDIAAQSSQLQDKLWRVGCDERDLAAAKVRMATETELLVKMALFEKEFAETREKVTELDKLAHEPLHAPGRIPSDGPAAPNHTGKYIPLGSAEGRAMFKKDTGKDLDPSIKGDPYPLPAY